MVFVGADFGYPYGDDRYINKIRLCYTRVYFESVAVWCAVFKTTLFLSGTFSLPYDYVVHLTHICVPKTVIFCTLKCISIY